ncbi:YcxB family protein [Actinoplanes sp. CA-252034]|uniref:YcxB family protein n=1 Tax=Actinoplanes sp. CA-252034 TaxID=3239906 RepID=UPI003D993C99
MLIEVDAGSPPLYVPASDRRNQIMARMPWWRLIAAAAPAAVTGAVAAASGSLALAVAGVALLLLPAVIGVRTWRRLDTSLNETQPVTRHWTITDDGIRVTGPGSARTWRWTAVVAVAASPDAYLMRQEGGIVLDLPRGAMTDAEDDELRRFLTARGLL